MDDQHDQPARLSRLRIDFKTSQRGVRLHRRMRYLSGDKTGFGNAIRLGKAFVGIAEDVVIVLLQVVRLVVVDEVGFRLHRFFRIEISGQHFVLHINQFQRPVGGGLIDRGNAGHVVPDVADLVQGERMFIVANGKNSVSVGRILANRDGDDAFQFLGAAGVNALDAGMRIR